MKVSHPATSEHSGQSASARSENRSVPGDSVAQLSARSKRSPVVRRLEALQKHADTAPLQRVKTAPMDIAAIRIHADLWGPMKFVLGPVAERTSQKAFDVGLQFFNDNRQRGQAIVDTLNARKAAEQDDPEGSAALQKSRAKAADKLHKNYKTTARAKPEEGEGNYLAGSTGKGSKIEAYSNWASMQDNALSTVANYGVRDPNRPKEGDPPSERKHLNNSEIFWQQWKTAVKKDINSGRKKKSRRTAKRAELSQVTRHGIVNLNTLMTTHHSLPNDQTFSPDVNVSFGAGSDEFLALLGTPNGRGVGFMLQDHYHEMNNQSFGDVDVSGADRNLTFHFV